jgi:hypothetical protein
MILAPWIERASTCGTFTSTLQVFVHCQYMLARTTKHRVLASSVTRPDVRLVRLAFVVAANARVEFVAAKVLDGNDIEG